MLNAVAYFLRQKGHRFHCKADDKAFTGICIAALKRENRHVHHTRGAALGICKTSGLLASGNREGGFGTTPAWIAV